MGHEGKLEFEIVHSDIKNRNSIHLLINYYENVHATLLKDERWKESVEETLSCLTKKDSGSYKSNNIHAILAQKEGKAIGGIICDYLAESNCGAVRSVAVDPNFQFKGVGTALYDCAIKALQEDAKKVGNASVDYIFSEIKKIDEDSDIKGMNYIWFWNKLGYKKLRLDYIQPTVDSNNSGDFTFDLVSTKVNSAIAIDMCMVIDKLKIFLYDYAKYAMRIENPLEDVHIIRMFDSLNGNAFTTIGFDKIMPKIWGT